MPQKVQTDVPFPTITHEQQLVAGYYVFNTSRGDVTDGPFTDEATATTAISTGQVPGGVPGPAISGLAVLRIPGDPSTTLVNYTLGKIWDKVLANIKGVTFNRTEDPNLISPSF